MRDRQTLAIELNTVALLGFDYQLREWMDGLSPEERATVEDVRHEVWNLASEVWAVLKSEILGSAEAVRTSSAGGD